MHESRRQALDVGAQQHGVVTRRQAVDAGMTDEIVDGCLADGLFVPLAPGVYRVRGAPQTERMAVMAATLAANGFASHATAARLFQLQAPLSVTPLHVTVDANARHPRTSRLPVEVDRYAFFPVVVHRSRVLADFTVTIDGIPTVDAARALIDLAPKLDADELEDAFERARKLGLVSTESLARRFGELGGRGRYGTPKVREVLSRSRPNALESKLEGKAWRMLRGSHIPEPRRQLRVDLPTGPWHRLDFAWPELLVAFETDGFEWHGSRGRWKRDRTRVAALERLGWRLVVATWDDVVQDPSGTLHRINLALTERSRLARIA